jgi:hypothetical protein
MPTRIVTSAYRPLPSSAKSSVVYEEKRSTAS